MPTRYSLSILLTAVLATSAWAQGPANFVLTRTYKQAGTSDNPAGVSFPAKADQVTSGFTFFNGLGLPVQTVAAFQAASRGHIVSLTEYDNQLRPLNSFQPAPFTNTDANPLATPNYAAGSVRDQAKSYYATNQLSAPLNPAGDASQAASRTVYEPSPLGRGQTMQAPGAGASSRTDYGVNSEGGDKVKYYRVSGSGLTAIELGPAYKDGELSVVRTTDERNSVVAEFRDRQGRSVLRRVGTGEGALDTYYVYDEKGQLRAVLQPNYQQAGTNTLEQSAFLYRYDDRGRIDQKQVPGSATQLLSYYDNTDRIRTLTDGRGQVFTYLYDNLNRQIELQVNGEAILKTYYDSYNFGPFRSYQPENGLPTVAYGGSGQQAGRRGLVTGQAARVLLPGGGYGRWLQTVNYYDDKYRLIQSSRQLYGLNESAFEQTSQLLSFDGLPQQQWITQITGSGSYRLSRLFSYDHANRLLRTDHRFYQNNLDTAAYVRRYTHAEQLYNELGQASAKSLHGGAQVMGYQYTPRGWLGQQRDRTGAGYGQSLSYYDNGNIRAQSWLTKNNSGGMDMSYDMANRLTGATGTGNFAGQSESGITYDLNGNLKSLNRSYGGPLIDQLSYQYKGNQLHRIDDGNSDVGQQAVAGFVNRTNEDDELTYDANGNLTRDLNRGVGQRGAEGIVYNALNLPGRVTIYPATGGSRTVQYVYDGSGQKLQVQAVESADNRTYAGLFEYGGDGQLQRVGLEEGQLMRSGINTYVVQYYLRDHLGNVRSVVDEMGGVLQETEYYAFGLSVSRSGAGVNTYLYNSKEKQAETNWLDYGARMYDPSVGRWITIDPMSEKMSDLTPYRFAKNNPILYIDPNGLLEFKNYEAYQAYAKKNNLEVLGASEIGDQGHWLKSDRQNSTEVWNTANRFNLQQENGYNQYTSIGQRADFYKWFTGVIEAKGFETNWPGAATIVAQQMSGVENFLLGKFVGEDVVKFANAGNKAIFNDVFDNLRTLYNGPVLKGQAAAKWDAQTLRHEQFDVVQPIYSTQSTATLKTLENMAKGYYIYSLGVHPALRFEGNLLSPQDRFNHGAGKVTNFYTGMKSPITYSTIYFSAPRR